MLRLVYFHLLLSRLSYRSGTIGFRILCKIRMIVFRLVFAKMSCSELMEKLESPQSVCFRLCRHILKSLNLDVDWLKQKQERVITLFKLKEELIEWSFLIWNWINMIYVGLYVISNYTELKKCTQQSIQLFLKRYKNVFEFRTELPESYFYWSCKQIKTKVGIQSYNVFN